MPVTYGNTAFDDARDVVVNALDSLAANMVSNSVVPRFDAVYDTHWETPALDYNCVSVGISEITNLEMGGTGRIEFLYRVELRVMTSETNAAHQEENFLRLANSIMNWFFAHLNSLGNGFHVKSGIPIKIEPNVTFDDTQARGGRIEFTIYGIEAYTQL